MRFKNITTLLCALALISAGLQANEPSSENNPRLKKALKKYPDADTNNDGILTVTEARAYEAKMSGGETDEPENQEPEVQNDQEAKPGQRRGFRGTLYTPAPGVTQKSEVYKTVDGLELAMHLHFPQGWKATDQRPVMIFFFGGGWKKGTPEQFIVQANHFAGRGIVTARANYRIHTEKRGNVLPDKCVEDARSAVRWLRANATKLGIDPEKVISSGGSAGGHLAYCTSIKESVDDPEDDLSISPIPQAMVLYNPGLFYASSITEENGLLWELPAEKLKAIAPLEHVDKDTPPAYILFGTKDGLIRGADEYLKIAKELGIRAEMFTAEGQSHGFFNSEPWMSKTIPVVDDFLVSLGYLNAQ
ncbi:MAG: alpha/beta hydrolase [Verrucomicrobiota bacterium]